MSLNPGLKCAIVKFFRWFFQYTTRLGAENMLSSNRNGDGSFLIRTAECQDQIGLGHNYSLSIKRKDSIGHFRVYIRLNQGKSEVSMNQSFKTLYPSVQALIERHSHSQRIKGYGLLKKPCVRVSQYFGHSCNNKKIDKEL